MEVRQIGPDGVKTVKIPQWMAVLLALGVGAIALLLIVLAAGAALILLPLLALIGLIYGWWIRRKLAKSGIKWPPGPPEAANAATSVIEADFVVIDSTGPDKKPNEGKST